MPPPGEVKWKSLSHVRLCNPMDYMYIYTSAAAKSLQSCLTLCNPIDCSPPGSPVTGILQARTLEWVAISFSNAWKSKVKVKSLSRAWLLATPWTAAYQAPPSMGFSRQVYWSGLPLPSPWYIYSPWNSPGQNIGVGSLSLLQRIFPTQGSNPGLLHCELILYQLSHQGSPRILEWVAYPFSSESSHPRNWTGDLPNPGIKPRSPLLHVDSLPAEPPGKTKYLVSVC